MKVLLITYYFPPTNVIGALRVGKWSKYLSDYGIEPYVLTFESDARVAGLPVEISENRVFRTGYSGFVKKVQKRIKSNAVESGGKASDTPVENSGRNVGFVKLLLRTIWLKLTSKITDVRFPDRAFPWYFSAVEEAYKLHEEHQFDAIISSLGPATSHLVAYRMAKKYKLPWIADYRDLWTQNHVDKRNFIHTAIERYFEKRFIKKASLLTTVSEELAESLRALHKKPTHVIQNGFDETDFEGPALQPAVDGFNVLYTGMIYVGRRDPSLLFEAVSQLKTKNAKFYEEINLIFYGADRKVISDLAKAKGVEDKVVLHDRCSNAEAIMKQRAADVLLLLEWDNPAAKGVLTGKLFEYLGAKRPILAIGPSDGAISKVLSETNAGKLFKTSDEIVDWLEMIYKRKAANESWENQLNTANYAGFTRRKQAENLADLLKQLKTHS